MVKGFIWAAILIVCLASANSSDVFDHIISKFQNEPTKELFKVFHHITEKKYELNSEEGVRRYKIFKANLQEIKEHNANPNNSWKMGITEYTDMTDEEWKIGQKTVETKINTNQFKNKQIKQTAPYEPFDWRQKGIDTPVRKDGALVCKSSAVIAMSYVFEAWNFLNTGNMKTLNPQSIIDCSPTWDCTQALRPAWDVEYTFWASYGFYEDSVYPFTGQKGTCNADVLANAKSFTTKKWEYPVRGNYDTDTVYNILKQKPYFFCFTENPSSKYKSGIFTGYRTNILCGYGNCGTNAAMVVGYGIENGKEFWIAKSTFGPTWGEKGYIRFERNDTNNNFGLNCLYLAPGLDSLTDA